MQQDENKEVESDGEEYKLPPVELPRRAITSVKSAKESVVVIPNMLKEQRIAIDESSIECLEYLSEGTYLAVGCSNGVIKIVSSSQKNTQFVLKSQDPSPVTGLAMNPNKELRHAFLATHSDGSLQYWHATSRQLLFSRKHNQMLQTCEISPEGTHYAFSGELGKVYCGLLNKGETQQFETGHLGNHDNRIFCIKWKPNDSNVLATGGWDRAVHFWDLRSKTSINKLFGYYIGGEAIDFKNEQVILGNNKPQHQLRIYDMKADKIRPINWDLTSVKQAHYTTGVLGCFFGSGYSVFACTPKSEVRMFDGEKCISQYSKEEEEEARLYCMQRNVLGNGNGIVTGWSDGSLRWFSL